MIARMEIREKNIHPKTLYMLIGPKGSGKTHIGTVVGMYTDIAFLRVEPIWLRLQPGEDGWKKVETAIDKMFEVHDKVMIESLGAGEGFRSFYTALSEKYPIKMIRVVADPDTCLDRVKSRGNINQIAVSLKKVEEYNRIAVNVHYDWVLAINNDIPLSTEEILTAIRSIDE